MAKRLGDRLRHVHLTDGTGSAKDEHLVPGRGAMGAASFLRHLAGIGFAGEIVLEINTRRCGTTEEREARPARVAGVRARALRREHAVSAVTAARAPRGRRPGRAGHQGGDPGRGPGRVRHLGFAGTSVRAIAAEAGVDPALVHHYFGTKDDLFLAALELPVDPREVLAPAIAGRARRRRRSGCCGSSSRSGTTRSAGPALVAVFRGILDAEGERLLREGFLPVVLGPVGVASASTGRSCGCRWSPARSWV